MKKYWYVLNLKQRRAMLCTTDDTWFHQPRIKRFSAPSIFVCAKPYRTARAESSHSSHIKHLLTYRGIARWSGGGAAPGSSRTTSESAMALQMEPSHTEQASACATPQRTPRLKSMISVLPADNSAYACSGELLSPHRRRFCPPALPGPARGGMAAGRDVWRLTASGGDAMSVRGRRFPRVEPAGAGSASPRCAKTRTCE